MIPIEIEKVYIILKTKQSVDTSSNLQISDIADVYCKNLKIKQKIESISVYESAGQENWDYITAKTVTQKIFDNNLSVDLEFIGPDTVLLEIKSKQEVNKFFEVLKLTFVSLILFFGAALGIIYFHEDVNMSETLSKLYFTFSGKEVKNPLIMTIPYSLGLAVGMFTFFKRVPSKSYRRKKEPGPLDVELLLYDRDMEEYILNELLKNKEEA